MTDKMIKGGLIGHGISNSLTPALHESEGQAQGLNYSYQSFDVATPAFDGWSFSRLLSHAEAKGFAGVNVTHPFKNTAFALCDELSETASALGAVNTIVFRNGRREGHNTDYIGFRSALRNAHNLGSLQNVLLLGAGGAGGAVALALVDQGVQNLTICDPAAGKSYELAVRLQRLRPRANILAISRIEIADDFSGVVNATPLGMATHPGVAIDPNLLSRRAWVGDIVYFPLETELLRRSRDRGLATLSGAGMAIYQAVAAFGLITGKPADPERVRAHFSTLSGVTENASTPAKLSLI